MKTLKKYDIFFQKLSIGNHFFKFKIEKNFFKFFSFNEEFEYPYLNIDIRLNKSIDFISLNFKQKGSVILICDYSLDKFKYFLNSENQLLIKFGKSFNDEDDKILIIPYKECKINIAKYIYEFFMLSLPKKRIHPEVQNGKSNSEVLKILNKYIVKKIPFL